MEKIPTLFERDKNFKVIPGQVRPECKWVFTNPNVLLTEKLDGINIRITIKSNTVVRVEKRRDPQKEKNIKNNWYVEAKNEYPENKWIFDAVNNTNITGWADGVYHCEAIGPKFQGNPLNLECNICVPFNNNPELLLPYELVLEDIENLVVTLESQFSKGNFAEGIVFHGPGNLRSKIKRKDFK